MSMDVYAKRGAEDIWIGSRSQVMGVYIGDLTEDTLQFAMDENEDAMNKLTAEISRYVAYAPKNMEDMREAVSVVEDNIQSIQDYQHALSRLWLAKSLTEDGWAISVE